MEKLSFEVERVIDHRDVKISEKSRRKEREYLVKWANFGHEHNSGLCAQDPGSLARTVTTVKTWSKNTFSQSLRDRSSAVFYIQEG